MHKGYVELVVKLTGLTLSPSSSYYTHPTTTLGESRASPLHETSFRVMAIMCSALAIEPIDI